MNIIIITLLLLNLVFIVAAYISITELMQRSIDLVTANQVIIDNKIEKLGAIVLKKNNQSINLN